MSSQAVDIYNSIKAAKKEVEKSVENLSNVLNNIQDGRQSFLGRIQKIVKFGRLTPKKKVPEEVKENIETEENKDQQVISLKSKENEKDGQYSGAITTDESQEDLQELEGKGEEEEASAI